MIYLDNAATTAPDAEAVAAAMKYLQTEFYNPSALYRAGFSAHKAVEEARKSILAHIAPQGGYELIFTSSGSEADNQALFSSARRGNFVTTEGEHAAVYNAARELSKRGIEVRLAKLHADGCVDVDDLLSKVDAKTSLVSVIHVNNETGAINDVLGISALVKRKSAAIFHSDGVQAFGKLPFSIGGGIDLYTISAHKIGGARGAAALLRRKGCRLDPFVFGGGQENGLRSGTENTFAIKQFEFAAEKKYKSLQKDFQKVMCMNRAVREKLDKQLFEIISSEDASPYILSVTARGLRGEVLLHMLDDAGVMVGTGSACSSKNKYSRVIAACGYSERRAEGVLRLSFFSSNTMEEVERAVDVINTCAQSLAERMK